MSWNPGPVLSFPAGEDLEPSRRVKLTAGGTVVYADADAVGIGLTTSRCLSGELVGVRMFNSEGSFELTAAGAFDLADELYAAADGKVQALPAAAGTYLRIGTAKEAATANNDRIEGLVADLGEAEVVTPYPLFEAGEILAANRRVKLTSTGTVVYADADAVGIGVTMAAAALAADVPVKLFNSEGTFPIAASEALDIADVLYAAADGKVQDLPTANGTYYQIGVPTEAATEDGDVIAVIPAGINLTATVSG